MGLVGSDHGVQNPEEKLREYSLQLEIRMPWMQMLVPRRLYSSIASVNRELLVTPLDLHRTVAAVIGAESIATPPWAFNLLQESIPPDRSCMDARVPPDFCACENEFLSQSPNIRDCPYAPKLSNCNYDRPHHCLWTDSESIS